MHSFQNLILLQNLYRLKALGFEYVEHFNINEKTTFEIPKSLHELNTNIRSCHLCDLSKARTQSMSGYGNQNAELMFIDFSVSQTQDEQNNHYAGRSGETLKNMIENVLLLRLEDVFITHAIKCKPLKSNLPSSSEWNSCQNYIFSQIDFIKPKVIVTLGNEAYAKLNSDEENFESVRGHVIDFMGVKLIPIYHPQHLLRNPELKKVTLNDLKTIKSFL